MKKSTFAGLTQIEDNESPTSDNNSFFEENIERIDHLLQLGAVTHRHDARGALANPLATPSGAVTPAGGTIEADQAVTIGYTLLDDQGGETAVSPSVTLSTTPPLDGPTSPLTGVVTYSSGALMTANYMYAITLTDTGGGETPIGPIVSLDRDPGTSFASITLFGLNTDFAVTGANGWRLYKSVNGEPFGYYASGTAASFVDYGQGCVDCGQPPPTRNRTNAANKITVVVPGNASATSGSGVTSGASLFRVYGSLDGTFDGDSLLGEFPTASAGSGITYTALNFQAGRPPVQSTAVRGAARVDAETLTNNYWRSPVSASAALPQAERVGEVRFTNLERGLYLAASAATVASGGIGWSRITSPPDRFWASASINSSLASGASGVLGIGLGPNWRLQRISASQSMRVRLYAASADQFADAGRAIGVDPYGDHGLYAEVVIPAGQLSYRLTPQVDGSSYEGVQQANPLTVTRMAASGAAATVAFEYMRTL